MYRNNLSSYAQDSRRSSKVFNDTPAYQQRLTSQLDRIAQLKIELVPYLNSNEKQRAVSGALKTIKSLVEQLLEHGEVSNRTVQAIDEYICALSNLNQITPLKQSHKRTSSFQMPEYGIFQDRISNLSPSVSTKSMYEVHPTSQDDEDDDDDSEFEDEEKSHLHLPVDQPQLKQLAIGQSRTSLPFNRTSPGLPYINTPTRLPYHQHLLNQQTPEFPEFKRNVSRFDTARSGKQLSIRPSMRPI
ncbi:hypothetical protein CAAN1_07S04082 [[Candida] anglica]|uniref:BHLH domain-containing protein n=1 Tax=[Candida] anglica TaxID=148631 RepID=A0ABP0EB86_9ASCO